MNMQTRKDFPVMRYVEPLPVEIDGQQMYYINDPLEIASSPLGLSHAHLYLIGLFDGMNSIQDIEEQFEEAAGGPPPPGLVEELVDMLDEHFYLNNERFQTHFQELKQTFLSSGVRKAAHAGNSYPADPEELQDELDAFYGDAEPDEDPLPGEVSAILAPHIDLRVGGTCYPHAFQHLKQCDADVFVILGVDHYGEGNTFNVCEMDFETPLGTAQTDRELLAAWNSKTTEDLTGNQWSHRNEHSIEFPVVFLQHAREQKSCTILPVLCGPIDPFLEEGLQPGRELLAPLQQALEEQGKRAVFILSVDLAHMGPKFGDPIEITEETLEQIHQADHQMLACLEDINASGFFEGFEADSNSRHVDAPMPVLSWMALEDMSGAKLLDYGQHFQPDTKSMVSYASMVFWR